MRIEHNLPFCRNNKSLINKKGLRKGNTSIKTFQGVVMFLGLSVDAGFALFFFTDVKQLSMLRKICLNGRL